METNEINVKRFCDVLLENKIEVRFIDDTRFELHGHIVNVKSKQVRIGHHYFEYFSFHAFMVALRKGKIWDGSRQFDHLIEKQYNKKPLFMEYLHSLPGYGDRYDIVYTFPGVNSIHMDILMEALKFHLVIKNKGPMILYSDENSILIKQHELRIKGMTVSIDKKKYPLRNTTDIGGVIEAIIQSHILSEFGNNLENYVNHPKDNPDKNRDDNTFTFIYQDKLWKKLNPGKPRPPWTQIAK